MSCPIGYTSRKNLTLMYGEFIEHLLPCLNMYVSICLEKLYVMYYTLVESVLAFLNLFNKFVTCCSVFVGTEFSLTCSSR